MLRRILFIAVMSFTLIACNTLVPKITPKQMSEIEQGKRYFKDGYYKRAFQQLLPPAIDGNAEAEYAIGYMYYYGYGVPQDTDTGHFWIEKAAAQHFDPAVRALPLMNKSKKITKITPTSIQQ
jgi:TPR repeat protein